MTVARALQDVLERSLRVLEAAGMATVEADPEWSSPCEYGTPDENGEVHWKSAAMDTAPAVRARGTGALLRGLATGIS